MLTGNSRRFDGAQLRATADAHSISDVTLYRHE
jgi:hypothetical protein